MKRSLSDLLRLSGEKLRIEAKRADAALAVEIDRLQISDPQFKTILQYSLAVEAEQLRRRGQPL